MAANLACDKFWVNKNMYHDAEKKYYENIAKLQPIRQNLLESVKEKNEESNKKLKENKAQCLKNCGELCSDFEINSMRIELENLEKKNEKNENVRMQSRYLKRLKNIEIENNKNLSHHDRVEIVTEKEMKQKEGKEKKNKSEKKNNRIKEREDISLGVGMTKVTRDSFPKTSLAGEVAKARQHLKSSLENMDHSLNDMGGMSNAHLAALLEKVQLGLENLTKRMDALEQKCASCGYGAPSLAVSKPQVQAKTPPAKESAKNEADDDIDLFGSDSEEEESEEAKKIKEQRLAEYAAKKSKKPALVAKSNIILDIKPWDDETDMKEMEKAVRAIEMDGLVWGASKLVPVAFKIFKLQISCVVEDDKVSVDLLTETLEAIEDYIQSVDIAAFNKV